ncbi:tenascin-X-like [Papio anubis]|uniref:tenascin-X-like n=1 Tax=Papio anubis TaxID=9555 RepID=UPI000B7B7615|nr:tenascin-X-like [Papio anubis]
MRVGLRAGNEAVFAQYDSFRVDSAAECYRLHLEGYHGTAGHSKSYHSGSVFPALDGDLNNLLISCAVSYRGAWWYRNCHYANLNGLYRSTEHSGPSGSELALLEGLRVLGAPHGNEAETKKLSLPSRGRLSCCPPLSHPRMTAEH